MFGVGVVGVLFYKLLNFKSNMVNKKRLKPNKHRTMERRKRSGKKSTKKLL